MNYQSNQKGVSLIELMITITLSLLIIAGAITLFISSKQSFRVQDSAGQMQENTRFSINYLAQTLRLADFWSGVEPANITVGTNSIAGISGAATCIASWIANPTDGIHGYEGGSTPPIDCIASADYVANSDMIAIRFLDPNSFTLPADLQSTAMANRNYVRARVGLDGYLYKGSNYAAADSAIPAGNGVLNYEYDFQLLFLRPCDTKTAATCSSTADNGKPIPTLVSLQLQADGTLAQVPLVDNVEQIQFEYGMDVDGDLVVDRYLKAGDATYDKNGVQTSATTDWSKIISVRASIVVRGDALDNFTDTKTYNMTSGFCYGPSSSTCAAKYTGFERYQRRLIVKDILIRNRIRQ